MFTSKQEDPTIEALRCSARPSLVTGLQPEGLDPSAWVAVSSTALQRAGSPGIGVVHAILEAGGRLAVIHYSGEWDTEKTSAFESLKSTYGEDRVALISCPRVPYPNLWLCDHIGRFSKTSEGTLQHLPIQFLEADEDGPGVTRAPISFDTSIVPYSSLWGGIYAKGGDFLVLDSQTIAISERARRQNFDEFEEDQLKDTLEMIGMKRAVFLPSTDDDVAHVDTMVSMINGVAFIPELYSGENEVLQERFKVARARLEAAGYTVHTLPMMPPELPGISNATLSPCNLRLMHSTEGVLVALVPTPENAPQDFQDTIRQSLMQHGRVDRVMLLESNPDLGGLIHCMSAEIPNEVAEFFRNV